MFIIGHETKSTLSKTTDDGVRENAIDLSKFLSNLTRQGFADSKETLDTSERQNPYLSSNNVFF